MANAKQILGKFGLDVPDGRPLHRYRLSADEYAELTAWLRQYAVRRPVSDHPGLLVLWASAWFCREYNGTRRKYDDLNAAIGVKLEEDEWRKLIDSGLKWLKRPVIKRAGSWQRLLTIAVEGGFPVRVLQAGEGWLSRYLNEVVGRLLGIAGNLSFDDAFAMADAAKEALRETYRQEAFIALAADLALAITQLRHRAEETGLKLAPSAILDRIDPGWRDELPIVADTAAARTLVDGMFAVGKIARGLSGNAGCARVLRRSAEGWSAGLRLSIEGELRTNDLEGLAERGTRLGVHPYGALMRAMGEELAFLDPPGEDDDSWRLRPLTRRTELDDVALEERIEVLIQSPNGAARVMPWPGGGPKRSDVMTFVIDKEDMEGPEVLVLAAQGSASLLAERAVVMTPTDWSMRWEDEAAEGAPGSMGKTKGGKHELWLIDKSVLVESEDGDFLYRVETGANEESRNRIELVGVSPRDFDSADNLSLFTGPPEVRCYQGQSQAGNEVLWRRAQGDSWQKLERSRFPAGVVGVIDIMWRDAQTGFVRDRTRAAMVPPSARVGHKRDGDGRCYDFQGFGELAISPECPTGLEVEQRSPSSFALSFSSNPSRRVTFRLGIPDSTGPIRITLSFPLRGGIADQNGRIVPPETKITPAELARLVAFSEGKFMLDCEIKGTKEDRPPYYTIQGERELGLRPLADRVRGDLASAGIDAQARLSILGDEASFWSVAMFDCEAHCKDGMATVTKVTKWGKDGEGPLILAGRSVAKPWQEERLLTGISLEDVLNRRPMPLPKSMTGAWWVYLRSARAVRSRPSIVSCGGKAVPIGEGLAATVMIVAPPARQAAIVKRLAAIAADMEGAAEDITWLNKLIGSLDGLPASTFDVLVALSDSPTVLARLLLSADEAAQGSIWRLETELPFLWAALPLTAWREATDALGRSVVNQLLEIGWPMDKAAPLGKQSVDSVTERTGLLDPAIGAVLAVSGLIPKPLSIPSIQEAAQGYIRRTCNHEGRAGVPRETSVFRTGELGPHLPGWFKSKFHPEHLEALDAPIAAAIASKTGRKLTPAQIRRCKEAMMADPVYFTEGITAALLSMERQGEQACAR